MTFNEKKDQWNTSDPPPPIPDEIHDPPPAHRSFYFHPPPPVHHQKNFRPPPPEYNRPPQLVINDSSLRIIIGTTVVRIASAHIHTKMTVKLHPPFPRLPPPPPLQICTPAHNPRERVQQYILCIERKTF